MSNVNDSGVLSREQEIEIAAEALFNAQENLEDINKRKTISRAERLQALKDRALALAEIHDLEKVLNGLIKPE